MSAGLADVGVATAKADAIAFIAVRRDDVPGERFAPIVELAAARVDATTLRLERLYSVSFRPTPSVFATVRDADGSVSCVGPRPLPVAGAVAEFMDVIEGAVLAAWDAADVRDDVEWLLFDADLMWRGDHSRLLDVPGIAWGTLGTLPESLPALADALGIDPPSPTALSQAWWLARAVMQMREANAVGSRIARLGGDEARIASHVIGRLEAGHKAYGPWRVDDGRDYRRETFEELIDGLHYMAAEVERLERQVDRAAPRRRRAVVLCLGDGARAEDRIAALVLAQGATPIMAGPVLAQFAKDRVPGALARRLLVDGCDEIRVYGAVPGPLRELVAEAKSRGVPVRYVDGEVLS
jgi:hypothetical protein